MYPCYLKVRVEGIVIQSVCLSVHVHGSKIIHCIKVIFLHKVGSFATFQCVTFRQEVCILTAKAILRHYTFTQLCIKLSYLFQTYGLTSLGAISVVYVVILIYCCA